MEIATFIQDQRDKTGRDGTTGVSGSKRRDREEPDNWIRVIEKYKRAHTPTTRLSFLLFNTVVVLEGIEIEK